MQVMPENAAGCDLFGEGNIGHLEELTVDIHISADVGASQGVGDLTGHWLGEKGVVHDDLVSVTCHLLDHSATFGPPAGQTQDYS